ncbi:MAG: hypothetical protein RL268_2507 [Pseudomonadota bacterium]|jgi:hypothetical protein
MEAQIPLAAPPKEGAGYVCRYCFLHHRQSGRLAEAMEIDEGAAFASPVIGHAKVFTIAGEG